MERTQFEIVRRQLAELIAKTEKIVVATRRQEISFITGQFIGYIRLLEQALAISGMKEIFELDMSALLMIVDALENGDYVLVADFLEEIILKQLKQATEQLVAGKIPEYVSQKYLFEYTSSGVVTVAKQVSGITKYLHANTSPMKEADFLARKWKTDGTGKYIVAGLGLGYQIAALYDCTMAEIEVYEEDEEIIRLAREMSDCSYIFENPNIKIYCDKGYKKFVAVAASAEGKAENPVTGVSPEKVCLFYPSIATICDEKLQEQMLRIFTGMDNASRWRHMLLRNFAFNTEKVGRYGDELKSKWQGKRVYLIAGGPSLDKNIHLLKRRKKDEIVLTVGTSLKKCIMDEIQPDYVFTTDPKPEGVYQFQGMEKCNVPMILLSTAYWEVVDSYEGEQYIVFQKGFTPAEKQAEKKGLMLYESGNSVTTTALDFCIQMEVKEVIFLGLDLANTGGKSHHSGTAERRDTSKESSIIVEDVYGNSVATSKTFNQYRLWIENRICKAKQEGSVIRFIDATEGGAKIAGTEITELSKLI